MKNLVYWFCVLAPFVLVRHYYGERIQQKMELPSQAMMHLASRDLATAEYPVQKYGSGVAVEEEEDKPSLRGSKKVLTEEPNVEPTEQLSGASSAPIQDKTRDVVKATVVKAKEPAIEEPETAQLDESKPNETETV